MDLGCYPVHWVRSLLGEEPEVVVAATGTKTQLGVDERITATLQFPGGTLADVTCGMAKGTPFKALLAIDCEHGTVEVENPVLAHRGHSIRERLSGGYRQHTVAGGTSYDHQLQAFKHLGFWQPMDTLHDRQLLESLWADGRAPWKVW